MPPRDALPDQSMRPRRRLDHGCVVEQRAIEDLKAGDLVQHYSTWDQTYGDPIRREVVKVEFHPDVRSHDLLVTWRDPTGEDRQDDYETSEKREKKVDVIVLDDWTVDPETGRANTSAQFEALVDVVARLIRSEGHALIRGDTPTVARLIVAQLAHKHGLAPTAFDEKRSADA